MSVSGRLLLLGFVLVAAAADWPQFLGLHRNGTSPETDLAASWPRKGPPLLWEKDVGDGYSGPVVAGDRLILFYAVGKDDVVDCLDAKTGKEIWKTSYTSGYTDDYGKGDGPRATPLIAGNRVYTLGAAGHLSAFAMSDGKRHWQTVLPEKYEIRKGFFGVATSPLLGGDHLLINVGGKDGAGIVAFDKDTGKEVWKATDQQASYSSPVLAKIDGVRHALFFTREGIVSLDPATGKERFSRRWRARIDASVNAAAPVVAGDLVFVSSSYNTGALVLRLKKDGVEEVWKGDEILSCHFNTPVAKDGFLYGIDGRQEGRTTRLVCVELKTGKLRWAQERYGCASIILANGHLILLTEDGDLVLAEANPDAYKEKARATILKTPPCRAEIALANGRLYARDGKKLGCWDLRKGTE